MRKVVTVVRKAAGFVLLCYGAFFLAAFLFAALVGTIEGEGALDTWHLKMIMIPVLCAIALSLIIMGAAMWGWNQRMIIFGIVSAAIGGFFALCGLLILIAFVLSLSGQLVRPGSHGEDAMFAIAAVSLSIIFIVAGRTMIIRQKRKDMASK